jgi:hypothetical protein
MKERPIVSQTGSRTLTIRLHWSLLCSASYAVPDDQTAGNWINEAGEAGKELIQCSVLDNGMRVFSSRAIAKTMGV